MPTLSEFIVTIPPQLDLCDPFPASVRLESDIVLRVFRSARRTDSSQDRGLARALCVQGLRDAIWASGKAGGLGRTDHQLRRQNVNASLAVERYGDKAPTVALRLLVAVDMLAAVRAGVGICALSCCVGPPIHLVHVDHVGCRISDIGSWPPDLVEMRPARSNGLLCRVPKANKGLCLAQGPLELTPKSSFVVRATQLPWNPKGMRCGIRTCIRAVVDAARRRRAARSLLPSRQTIASHHPTPYLGALRTNTGSEMFSDGSHQCCSATFAIRVSKPDHASLEQPFFSHANQPCAIDLPQSGVDTWKLTPHPRS